MNKYEIQELFGYNMRIRRQQLSLSQEELAFKCGLHRNYISDVERGTRNVSLKSLEKIAMGLETTVSVLLNEN